jgi:hypothetical protein
MQAPRLSIMLGIVFLTAALARADKVSTDYDRTVNFAKYKTFMWIDQPQTAEPFMSERIMASVNRQLTARGLRLVSDGADLAIGANLATEEKHTWETYYSGSGWGWGSGWSTTTERTYQVGTLTVDLFDAQSKKLVWEGVGIDTLSRHADKRIRDTDKQVGKMFRDFPFLSIGSESLVR